MDEMEKEEGEYVPFYNVIVGSSEEEEPTYERVFHLREHSCSANNLVREIAGEGENDEQVLELLRQVTSLMDYDQEKYQEVEPLYRRLLKVEERVLGTEDKGTMATVSNFAKVLKKQRKWDEAEPLLRHDLEWCERVLGMEHEDTLAAVVSLGGLLENRGKLKEAEVLY